MGNFGNYKRDESGKNPLTGKMRCVIVSAEETVSKSSGLPMIVVSVRPSGCDFSVKTYIVNNDNFNKNMTQFFDAFPEIGDGNFEFLTWIGAEGAANFGEDDNGYLKIKRWVYPEQAESLPPFEGKKPERQEITSLADKEDEDPEDDGDLPFV